MGDENSPAAVIGDPAVRDEAPPQETLDEMLFPDLSRESFLVDGKRFALKMMPFQYEKEVLSLVKPALGRFLESQGPEVGEKLLDEAMAVLPAVVAVICRMTDQGVTAEWVSNRMVTVDMVAVVKQQLIKNKLMDAVSDFFRRAQARGVATVLGSLSMR